MPEKYHQNEALLQFSRYISGTHLTDPLKQQLIEHTQEYEITQEQFNKICQQPAKLQGVLFESLMEILFINFAKNTKIPVDLLHAAIPKTEHFNIKLSPYNLFGFSARRHTSEEGKPMLITDMGDYEWDGAFVINNLAVGVECKSGTHNSDISESIQKLDDTIRPIQELAMARGIMNVGCLFMLTADHQEGVKDPESNTYNLKTKGGIVATTPYTTKQFQQWIQGIENKINFSS